MVYLHILGEGISQPAISNSKGHLFEHLMKGLLEHLKINVTHLNKSENGLEIDIEGVTLVGDVKIFAECKAKEDPLDSPAIQQFGYKYMVKSARRNDVKGFLFTLSSLNPKAQELWENDLEDLYGNGIKCYQEKEIITLLLEHYGVVSPEVIRKQAMDKYRRTCGDTQLLCIKGNNGDPELLWAQLLMSSDETEPNWVVFYNSKGAFLENDEFIQRILELKRDLATSKISCLNLEELPLVQATIDSQTTLDDVSPSRTVVRVRMSSDWFDYRFPSAPQFFVGRKYQRNELENYLGLVRRGTTSARGFLISGQSGIGKSSLALKARDDISNDKVILLPIDSRLCDDVSFLFDSVNELLFELRNKSKYKIQISGIRVLGLDSLIETLTGISNAISQSGYIAILFFDQFEKVLEYPEVTKAIRNLFLRVTERQLFILFGFAWKSDLWSLAEGFPHRERDDLVRESFAIKPLKQFGQEETDEILKQLEIKWGKKLNPQMRHQLATFSRGLPWLLKKVCAHVLDQKQKGVTENELIETHLKLEDLFEADLAGLDDEERALLGAIAHHLPATLRRLSESFELSNIDQSLHRFIDKRILLKITEDIGESYADVKYDAYSDIFREYLITGRVPIEDAFYFTVYPPSAFKFFEQVKTNGSLSINEAIRESGKQKGSLYNVSRDLRNLGLVKVNNKVFTISDEVNGLDEDQFLSYLQGQMKRNRVVNLILAELNTNETLSIDRVISLLKELFPSVERSERTWTTYGRMTATWLNEARLALYRPKGQVLERGDDESIFEQFLEKTSLSTTGYRLPVVYRNAIIQCLIAVKASGKGVAEVPSLMKWLSLSHQSVEKALSDNIKLGFLEHGAETGEYKISRIGDKFLQGTYDEKRSIFRQQCIQIDVFNKFLSVVVESGDKGITSKSASNIIVGEYGFDLADATIEKLGSILSNWAEFADTITRVGPVCYTKGVLPEQMRLF